MELDTETRTRPGTHPPGPTESFTKGSSRYAVLNGRTLAEAVDDHELWLDSFGEEGACLEISGEEGHSAVISGDVSGRDLSYAKFSNVTLRITAKRTQFEGAEFGECAVLAPGTDVRGANFYGASFAANQQKLNAEGASFVNATFKDGASLCSGNYEGADFRGACDEIGRRNFANFSPAGFIRENGGVSAGTQEEVESWTKPYGGTGERLRLYKQLFCIQNTARTDKVRTSVERCGPVQRLKSFIFG